MRQESARTDLFLRINKCVAMGLAWLAVLACNGRKVQKPYCDLAREIQVDIPVISNKLDLLVMVDDSGSMKQEQENVFCNFPRFVEALESLPGGLPDLHLGVISPNVGSGAFTVPSCERLEGDDGRFQTSAHPQQIDCTPYGGSLLDTTGCSGPEEQGYISYRANGENNVGDQSLTQAFACIGALGTGGCGLEGQLRSVQRALERASEPATDPDNPNRGFLREDAFLMILMVTDEDDCSVPPDSALFDPTGRLDLNSPLGPAENFRCTEFGILCDGQPPPRMESGELSGCVSNEAAHSVDPLHALLPVGELRARIEEIKHPNRTIVEAISGPPPPDGRFSVSMSTYAGQPSPELDSTCGGGRPEKAAPAVRIQEFLEGYEPGKKVVTICQDSFASALDSIAARVVERIGARCLGHPLLDREGRVTTRAQEADCIVSDVQDDGLGSECRVPLAQCGEAQTTVPGCVQEAPAGYEETCWRLRENPVDSSGNPVCRISHLALDVCRVGFDPQTGECLPGHGDAPPNTTISVRCAACAPTNGGVECIGDGLDNDCDGQIDDHGEICDCA